jgi:hypothetical protein
VTVRLRRASEQTHFYATRQTPRGGAPVTLALPGPAAAGRGRFSITLAHARGVRFVTLGVLPWSRRYATTREIRVG